MRVETVFTLITIVILISIVVIGVWILTLRAWLARPRRPAQETGGRAQEILLFLATPLRLFLGILLLIVSILLSPVLTLVAILLIPIVLAALGIASLVPRLGAWVRYIDQQSLLFGRKIFQFCSDAWTYPGRSFHRFVRSLAANVQVFLSRFPEITLDDQIIPWIFDRLGIQHGRESILLTLATSHKQMRVRLKAVEQLGKMDSFKHLFNLGRTPAVSTPVRVKAAEILQERGPADQAARIWLSLADCPGEDLICLKVSDNLYRLGREVEARSVLKDLLGRPQLSSPNRAEAAEKLGRFGDKPLAKAELLRLIEGCTDPHLLYSAAAALSSLGFQGEAVPVLNSLAVREKIDLAVRVHAVEELGRLGRSDLLLNLATIAHLHPHIRKTAAWNLELLGSKAESIQAWAAIFTQEKLPRETRIAAAGELARLGDQSILNPVLNLGRLPDTSNELRLKIAGILLTLDCSEYAKELLLSLENKPGVEKQVKRQARQMLARIDAQD